MKSAALLALPTLVVAPAGCQMQQDRVGGEPGPASFVCDGGNYFAVNFGMEGETPSATLTMADGETFLLLAEPAASGARYGWPSDGTNYVLLTQGQQATVLLKDGTLGGVETPVYSNCRLQ